MQALLGELRLGVSFLHANPDHRVIEEIGVHSRKIKLIIGSAEAIKASGINLSGHVKDKHPHIPIVLFGKGKPPEDLGADVYLIIPLNQKEFRETIKRLIKKK